MLARAILLAVAVAIGSTHAAPVFGRRLDEDREKCVSSMKGVATRRSFARSTFARSQYALTQESKN